MKISEIITESSEQILVEARTVLRDLPGKSIDFKILNPENVGKKKIDPRIPKYKYFAYSGKDWHERKNGIIRRTARALNPLGNDDTYMVRPEDLGRKLDPSIEADNYFITALNKKYEDGLKYLSAAYRGNRGDPPEKRVEARGPNNAQYYYNPTANLWYLNKGEGGREEKPAPPKIQAELFKQFGRDPRGEPLLGAVDTRDVQEIEQQKIQQRQKEFTRQDIVIWRNYSNKLKAEPQNTADEKTDKIQSYYEALDIIAKKRREENININPLTMMFHPKYIFNDDIPDPKVEENYKKIFGSTYFGLGIQALAGGRFSGVRANPASPDVDLTSGQVTKAQSRIQDVFTKALELMDNSVYPGTARPNDAEIEAVARQVQGYAADLYTLMKNPTYGPAKIMAHNLPQEFIINTQNLANRIKPYAGASMTGLGLREVRGMLDSLSRTAGFLEYMASLPGSAYTSVYTDIKRDVFDPIKAFVSGGMGAAYPDDVAPFSEVIRRYEAKQPPQSPT